MRASERTASVCRVRDGGMSVDADALAVEEPLEVRLGVGDRRHAVSVTMRTPGHDAELAVGFLFAEGVLTSPDQLAGVHACKTGSVVCVDLRPGVAVELAGLERHFAASSACGVCGKAALEAVRVRPSYRTVPRRPVVGAEVVCRMPDTLRAVQAGFDRTGGLHAAGLFDAAGRLLAVREDVGRHNALDKLVGAQFLAGGLPLNDRVLMLSGRASFELVQKAAVAGVPVVAAVGAPSSLAVDVAREHGLTLLGFVRGDGFNVYAGAERVAAPQFSREPLAV